MAADVRNQLIGLSYFKFTTISVQFFIFIIKLLHTPFYLLYQLFFTKLTHYNLSHYEFLFYFMFYILLSHNGHKHMCVIRVEFI